MSDQENQYKTTPTRPYLTRALYEWIEDNNLTPYLHVDATLSDVIVPREHVRDGQIVLNISSDATHQLIMANNAISFNARFGGVSRNLHIPFTAVMGIYAKENGQGMFFDPAEYNDFTLEEIADFGTDNKMQAKDNTPSAEALKKQKEEEKAARIEKAKKSGFRVIE